MKLDLTLQQHVLAPELVLKRIYIKKVIETALRHLSLKQDCDIGIACVDLDESHELNLQYRQKDKPTNVLSFPSEVPEEVLEQLDCMPLGDLVICIPVVLEEAKNQKKTAIHHFTHMLVHGVLHLLGYDHEISEADAEEMEQLEIEILQKLHIDNPYHTVTATK
ncbi:rRNA maturation RNase YbeY [Acinetobacter boissieri]|uniref:Endoribonuclease YbeY n=1 Tax=Acinetobacter boissieri TaxID=1219383 RepID=A0A1G6HU21_9GAMM|nr:rRNA maturation RNase YbeY [Acinetobacter boissieri]SDB97335.1 probable rRNA maturation factor [Acinetobacter boissieri]